MPLLFAALLIPALAFAAFNSDLRQGDSGPLVVELQNFLISRGHLTAGNNTGFFGPLTLAAVKAFQSAQNISPVSGFFGPLTRAAANALLAKTTQQNQCPVVGVPSCQGGILEPLGVDAKGCQIGYRCVGSSGGSGNSVLSANPNSGTAPLIVTFTYTSTASGGSYVLNFGDGSDVLVSATVQSGTINHAYVAPGTYTATLKSGGTTLGTANVAVNLCTGSNCARPSSCPAVDQIRRILKQGMSGNDVSALQDYLGEFPSIYPEKLTTGYFGAATEKAVQRWQSAHNIVTSGSPESNGWGVIGPKTIKALREACGLGALPSNPSDTSTPTASQLITLSVGQSVFLGGTSIKLDSIADNSASISEVPGSGGNFVSYFFSGSAILGINEKATFGEATIVLKEVNDRTQRATFAVTVPETPILDAEPRAAATPVTILFSVFRSSGTYSLLFGDGASTTISFPTLTCAPGTASTNFCGITKTATHHYTKGGNLKASLEQGSTTIASVDLALSGGLPPTITSLSKSDAKVGEKITITGTNLTSITSVYFSGVSVGVYPAKNESSLEFAVPQYFESGQYDVTVGTINGTSNAKSLKVTAPPKQSTSGPLRACYMNGQGYDAAVIPANCGSSGAGNYWVPQDSKPTEECKKYQDGSPICTAGGWTSGFWGMGYVNSRGITVGCTSHNGILIPGNMRVPGNRCIAQGTDVGQDSCDQQFVCKRDGWWRIDTAGFELERVSYSPWVAPEVFYPQF